ncbi:MAG TPA: UDP-2,3-diacylglucosamine diphosphatase [Ignavibacteria bacterium]|nr:UDP-2,3-diacylglucosamine diphosphatase [Bacteroidota bacterium]HRI84395.1 UDP-2,3-diacylglucosamine diphosphatase [Ignavibacteria bacterium]HRK00668.1 UDP-2,3-diacylglucosamine diphosphatase [Ignavibacteria bacterium]
MKMYINTLIVSDIHLGSPVARPKEVLELLQGFNFKRLILLGDIFDDLNFKRLKKEHWNLLSYIRKLSNPGKNIEVVWVEGNHDEGLIDKLSHLIGIEAYSEYEFEISGNKIIAVHGHQFDRFLNENIFISNISSFIYNKIQKYDRENQALSRFIKRKSKGWLRLSHKVADSAIEYAKKKNRDTVICGHTHQILQKNTGGIKYFNTGCWTDIPSTYITIDFEGNVRISEFFELEKLKLAS